MRVISFFLCLPLCAVLCVAQSGSESSSDSTKQRPTSPAQVPAQGHADSAQLPDSAGAQKAQANAQAASADQHHSKDKRNEDTGTSDDRLFWTLPNFLSVSSKDVPPLTTGQKFKVVARGTFDPIEGVYIAFLSGISQAQDSEKGYGQGAAGYGKRYGAAFADNAIENFMTGAIFPSLLKQDPRFYELGNGGFSHRLDYSVSRIFLTRSDSGHTQFNFSEVVGSALSAGISTYAYHPKADRTVGNALSVWGTQVGWDTVTIVAKEFWPDVRRKRNKNKRKVGSIPAPPATRDPGKPPSN